MLNNVVTCHARFGGLDWSSDVALDQFDYARHGGPDPILVSRMEQLPDWSATKVVGRAGIGNDRVHFDWGDEASFEIVAPSRIGWHPRRGWKGQLPAAFGSTVTAILMAMRGMVPLHASTVVLGGRAWLIAGNAGAGKSTLAAELTAAGAKLLADDLTIVSPGLGPLAFAGRPTIRLHAHYGRLLESDGEPEPAQDGRGKVVVRPLARAADRSWPIGGILLLDEKGPRRLSAVDAVLSHRSMLFRPRIVSAVPGGGALRRSLFDLARKLPIESLPIVEKFESTARASRVEHALQAINRLQSRTQ